jgi:two-component system, sensor histidine kinase RegB
MILDAINEHLRRLVILRDIVIVTQCLTLAGVYRFLGWSFNWPPIIAAIVAMIALNLVTRYRLRVKHFAANELFFQLCADVLLLSVVLYFCGGSTNPFIFLFLLPLVITAATLPRQYTWGMAGLTTLSYTVLMKFYVPLPVAEDDMQGMEDMSHGMDAMHGSMFDLHVLGMWMGFVFSAATIAFFVVKMAEAVRERDERLARVREETLRDERIMALGIQAAMAAHELSTPLSTIAVISNELQHAEQSPECRESLTMLDNQVKNCRRILDKLLREAREGEVREPLPLFLAGTLDEWKLLRPNVVFRYRASDDGTTPFIAADKGLRSALLNLLNNAADASPNDVEIEATWRDHSLNLEIRDKGKGLGPEAIAKAGSAFFTTKEEGKGLGLMLANASIERLGGKVRLFNREGGGATTIVTLPLSRDENE